MYIVVAAAGAASSSIREKRESLQGNINKKAALFCLLQIRGEERKRTRGERLREVL
jgi:hypothetical protein